MKTIIKVLITGLLLGMLACSAYASCCHGDSAPPVTGDVKKSVKIAVTGDTMAPFAMMVENLAIDDGARVYDRSRYIIGVLRAEANLMKEYGNDRAREQASGVLQNLSAGFFADIWIDFNITSEVTTVTIKAGDKTKKLTFPTPLTKPEMQVKAMEVYGTAMGMLGP